MKQTLLASWKIYVNNTLFFTLYRDIAIVAAVQQFPANTKNW